MANISEKLAYAAKSLGICAPGFARIFKTGEQADPVRALLDYYVEGIDFCLSNEFPGIGILKEYAEVCSEYGIYVDAAGLQLQDPKRLVCLGATSGAASFAQYAVGEVYAKHQSQLTIVARNNTFISVDMFDESRVTVMASENAKVCVHRYGGHLITESAGASVIKVIDKHKTTY